MPGPPLHRLLTPDYFTTSRNCLRGYNSTVNSEICKVFGILVQLKWAEREMGEEKRTGTGRNSEIKFPWALSSVLSGDWCK